MIARLSLAALLALVPAGAFAHTLDEFGQAARVSLTWTDVRLDLDLTPGVLVAEPIVRALDRDLDGVITPGEAAAYGQRVLADLVVELEGRRVAMTLARADVPSVADMRDGMGTIRLTAVGPHDARLGGTVTLMVRNDHAPSQSVYAVNALVPVDRRLTVRRQTRDVLQRSVRVEYDVRPTVAVQLGWSILAVAMGALVVSRRRRR